jgi:hypothetical protein
MSEPYTPHSVHIKTSPYQSFHLPNTTQNTISYPESYFRTSNYIFSIQTNVPISICPFNKYHKVRYILPWKLFLNVTPHTQYTHKRPHINQSFYQIPHKTPYPNLKVISEPHTPYSLHIRTSTFQSVHLLNIP